MQDQGPIIPTRQHSLPLLPSDIIEKKHPDSYFEQPILEPILKSLLKQKPKQPTIQSDSITLQFALKQAEQAVEYDKSNDLENALFCYREAILALHSILFNEKMNLHSLSLEEESNLENILMQYKDRVDEIGQGIQYSHRPSFNSNSIWSPQTVYSGERSVSVFIHEPAISPVFNVFNKITESTKSGAFLTSRLYISKEIWDQKVNCPLSDIKALYLESLIPHYTELAIESDPQKQSEIASSLNGILLLLKQSLEKHAIDNPERKMSKSPMFTKSHTTLNTKSSNSSLNKLALSPPKSKRLIDKLKRMTGKVEVVYSGEYISKLKDFLNALMKIANFKGLEEHENLVSEIVLSFVLSDIDYLTQIYVKGCMRN